MGTYVLKTQSHKSGSQKGLVETNDRRFDPEALRMHGCLRRKLIREILAVRGIYNRRAIVLLVNS